jgi:GDP-D-mannose 3', 5'-epimerase
MVTINQLAEMAISIAGKKLSVRHIAGPQGVRGRNSDNRLIRERLGWEPSRPLREGMEKMYAWISAQVEEARTVPGDQTFRRCAEQYRFRRPFPLESP